LKFFLIVPHPHLLFQEKIILLGRSKNSGVTQPDIPQPDGLDFEVGLQHLRNLWAFVSLHLIFGGKGQNCEWDFWINIENQLGNLLQLGGLHQVGDIKGKDLQNKTSFDDLLRKFENISVETAGQPFMVCPIIGLDIEPERIDPCLLQCIEVLRGEAIAICLDQYPKISLCLNKTGTLNIILWATGQISTREGHDIASGPPSLRTQKNIFLLDDLRAERRSLSIHHTGSTTTAGIVGMKCSGFAPRLSKGNPPLILFTCLQYIGG
jgi:hypothetical protein